MAGRPSPACFERMPQLPHRAWPDPRLFDFLKVFVRKEPVVVRGALGFGLRAIGKARHAQGLIGTSWADGPTGGLGAMVGGVERRGGGTAARGGDAGRGADARYNEVDCRVMA